MNISDFRSRRAGRVIKASGGYHAFVPAPLPPKIRYDERLMVHLSQADAALSELSGMGRYLPNPNLLIQPYMRREAVASSQIEGTQADLTDVYLDEIEPERTPPQSDVREVRNYVAALEHGIRLLESLPLSGRLVREIHGILMRDVRGQERTPGEFRRSQNWIGPPGSTLANATYVPPPHHPEMHECLKHWENFLNERDTIPDLIQCALIHEHFEAIHPFLDGNGRVGRLLITLFLIERGRLSKPLLYVSSVIEQRRQEYYRLLQRIRTHGEWSEWLAFFLTAVRDASRNAIIQSQTILSLRETLRDKLAKKHRLLALLEELFLNPYMDVARAAKYLGVSTPTASRDIKVMEEMGILKEISGKDWGRLWVADTILNAVRG